MFRMNFALRWSWVLGIALFLPVALPAGGARWNPAVHAGQALLRPEAEAAEYRLFQENSAGGGRRGNSEGGEDQHPRGSRKKAA